MALVGGGNAEQDAVNVRGRRGGEGRRRGRRRLQRRTKTRLLVNNVKIACQLLSPRNNPETI